MISFRPMCAADVPAVAAIETRAHRHPRPASVFLDELTLSHAVLEVALWDEQIVGFMDYWEIAGELELMDIAVDPDFQGRGLGRLLLRRLLEVGQRAERVLLEVNEDNRAARALYESEGFTVVGERARYYPDGNAAVLYDWVHSVT